MKTTWLVLALALTAVASTQADPGRWSSIGPNGGEVFALETHPTDPNILYALANGGLFKTSNGGLSWQRVENGLIGQADYVSPLLLDPDEPQTLYVFDGYGRMYVSRDGAASWRWNGIWISRDDGVYPTEVVDIPGNTGSFILGIAPTDVIAPADPFPYAIRFDGYGAPADPDDIVLPTGLPPGRTVAALAVDPSNPQRVLLGMGGYLPTDVTPPFTDPVIYLSNDGGLSYSPVFDNPGFVFFNATTSLTVHVSDVGFGPNNMAFALISDTASGNAVRYQALHVNDSGGAAGSWKKSDGQVIRDTTQNCFLWPRALMPHPGEDNTVYAGSMPGVMRFNLGSLASEPVPANGMLLNNGLSANANPQAGTPGPLPAPPCDLAPSIGFPGAGSGIFAATLGAGLMRTTDAGFAQFAALHQNAGLAGVHVRGLSARPDVPGALLSGVGDSIWGSAGIFATSGSSWSPSNSGFGGGQVRQIMVDPTTPGRVYAVGRAPTTKVGVIGDNSYRNHGIYRSTDAGASWTNITGNLPNTAPVTGTPVPDLGIVRKLILDPRSCGSPPFPTTGAACTSGPLQRLYVVADGRTVESVDLGNNLFWRKRDYRILRSDDGGATFVDLSANPGFPESVAYVSSNSPSTPAYYSAIVTPTQIVMDPSNSARIWVSTLYNPFDFYAPGGPDPADIATGIYYSDDAGATWQPRVNGLPNRPTFVNARQDALALAIDPTNGNTLWATQTVTGGGPFSAITATIYKTTDGGLNWSLSDQGVHDVADIRAIEPDPATPNTLYATGSGSESNPASVFKSKDAGSSWRSISVGLPSAGGATIAIDPFDTDTVSVGSRAGVWTLTQLPDLDDDGISDDDEGGLGPPQGNSGRDTNGDGIEDARQRGVGGIGVSIRATDGTPVPVRTTAVRRELSLPNGGPEDCLQAVDVQDYPSFQFGRDIAGRAPFEYAYPYRLRRIEVLNCAHAVVDFIYQGADFGREYGWSFRYRGPQTPGVDDSIDWYGYSAKSLLMPPQTYDPTHQTTWRVTVDANTFGSYRPLADRVLFVGGPACYDDRIFRNSLEDIPDTGPPGCGP